MKNILTHTAFLSLVMLAFVTKLSAQVPQLISYQGRVGVDGVNFDGSGQFKFAFVNAAGTTTYWSNDGSSTAGSEPSTAISIPVSKGLYSVLLGDATLAHMSIVPATVFTNGDVHLRVWFSDGVNGFQQLAPDRRIAAVGYAMMADSVSDGAITTAKIADGAVTSEKLAAGVVQTANLATGAVGNTQLANSGLTINAGTGLGGGGLVSLGGNLTLSNAGVLSLTGGGGITVDAGTGVITLGSSATSAGTAGAIVARDASGGFTAGTITAALNGNAATATSATSFTGPLTGDVTGTQAATTIAATTVTGKVLTGFTSAAGILAASDTLLSAISKLDGNVALKAPLASPTFTGSVTLPAGTATAAPLLLQTGPQLTTPALGAVEFDGTNVFVTNNSTSPTRKTVAFTDTIISASQIADGSVTSAKLANGSIGSAQLAVNAVQADKIASGAVGAAQLATGAAAANLNSAGQSGVPSGGLVLSATENAALIEAGYIKIGETSIDDTWQQRNMETAPSPRTGHTAVWTGTEMIVWGGTYNNITLADGGRYNPSTRSWSPISQIGAPARDNHTAFWTGTEMIIFGYQKEVHFYNPSNDSWRVGGTSSAPEYHQGRTAIWTGTELIVFGGERSGSGAIYNNTGARYNLATDTWVPLSTTNAPGLAYHTAIWTGSEMIVFGGLYAFQSFAEGGARYNPTTDVWTALSTTNAPQRRYRHNAIWTGSEMIIWGGEGTKNYGRYNPSANDGNGAWVALDSNSGPLTGDFHKAIWTGSEMIVYGGFIFPNIPVSGGRYNPNKGLWLGVSATGAPTARNGSTTIWTGSEMLVYGGISGTSYFREVSSYTPGRQMYLYQRP